MVSVHFRESAAADVRAPLDEVAAGVRLLPSRFGRLFNPAFESLHEGE